MRVDQRLVELGLAASRSQAQRLIAAGVRWQLPHGPWQTVRRNSDELPAGACVELLDAAEARYVSRGGLKLEGALQATGLSVQGRCCLDVGQSTGGFTDCLLQHGASRVVGLDVGHGQLHPRLRSDERVVCIEGLNARELQAADPRVPGSSAGFDCMVGDVSFISLTLIWPALLPLLRPDGHLLMLVKPQFELQPGQVGKGGIVRDQALYVRVRERIEHSLQSLGFKPLHWLDSPIPGGDGNHEFFVHAVRAAATP